MAVRGHRGVRVQHSHDPNRPTGATILLQGTSTTESVFAILPRLADSDAPNVKVVAAVSYELFMRQEQSYRDSVLPRADWWDSTVISNGARRLMHDWLPHKDAEKFAQSLDHDNRWRTGGNVAELKVEAKIDPESLWEGISRFARERTKQG
ncbi:hypothetical protein [Engelhardtia mirabilis]|uniref:Uncharacterized protein n=1 Tax=Engelhardtia mirabilis TaxID=2528011 RepID=A0A518BDH2_9BACT|nr:hypothetical protein Pla133_00880 [Planctomycetes bacterium Pla133]QDU99351.1 hypothetical protein Pla86_00880 [Planctomycetes bacterium Pla86]